MLPRMLYSLGAWSPKRATLRTVGGLAPPPTQEEVIQVPGLPLLVKRFRTESGRYVYDACVSRIFETDRVAYDVIEDTASLSPEGVVEKWACTYPLPVIQTALANIGSWHATVQGQSNALDSFTPPACEECIGPLLDSRLEQLTLNVSERCNLRCAYCSYSGT
jgi:uncharacterized protein